MAWIVSIILILFYVLGTYAFHETSLIRVLPFVVGLVLLIDFVLARAFKRNNSHQR
jgi:ABC-type uncharacterized transport system permease subunit